MSGTSLDGLDMAYCHYQKSNTGWTFEIVKTRQIPYDNERREELRQAIGLSALDHTLLDQDLTGPGVKV